MLGSMRIETDVSINYVINSRWIRTRLIKCISWNWRNRGCMDRSTSVRQFRSSLHLSKTFLFVFVHANLFLAVFIFIIVCHILNILRILHQLLGRERNLPLEPLGYLLQFYVICLEKYYSNKIKRGNVCYC